MESTVSVGSELSSAAPSGSASPKGANVLQPRRRMTTIPRHLAEKDRNRESQRLSGADRPVLALVREPTPSAETGKVTPPRRVANRERRTREHLTPQEVEKLIRAASGVGRYGHRDATLILVAYRHGLRVSELVALRWDQIDLEQGLLHVSRLKNGVASTHPLRGPELRALRRLRRQQGASPYVLTTERGSAMTDSSVRKIIARAGDEAHLGFPVHPHMLRHACGFKLANEGHDTRAIQHYLGHRNITHTVRYTELAADRFKQFWKD
jgi:type 1 fimbriae regulatory protein FimE